MDAASVDLAQALIGRADATAVADLLHPSRRPHRVSAGRAPGRHRAASPAADGRRLRAPDHRRHRACAAATARLPRPSPAARGATRCSCTGCWARWGIRARVEGLPDTIEAMVVAQVDRLGTTQRRLIRHASVLGLAFSTDLVAMLLDPDDEIHPSAAPGVGLEELLAQTARASSGSGTRSPATPPTRALSYRRRRELHARAAAAIDSRRAGAEDDLDLLALHYLRAGDNRPGMEERAGGAHASAEAEFRDRRRDRSTMAGRSRPRATSASCRCRPGRDARGAGRPARAHGALRRRRRPLHRGPAAVGRRPGGAGPAVLTSTRCWPSAAAATRRRCAGCGADLRGLDGNPELAAARQRATAVGLLRHGAARPGAPARGGRTCSNGRSRRPRRRMRSRLWRTRTSPRLGAVGTRPGTEAVYSSEALKLYERARQARVPRPVIYNNLGTFTYAEGRWDEAVELYEQELRPAHAAGRYRRRGHRDEQHRRGAVRPGASRAGPAAVRGSAAGVACGRLPDAGSPTRSATSAGWPTATVATPTAIDLLERARETFRQMRADPEVVETDARRAECLLLQGASAEALRIADDTVAGHTRSAAPSRRPMLAADPRVCAGCSSRTSPRPWARLS